jgi:hypothetical protein
MLSECRRLLLETGAHHMHIDISREHNPRTFGMPGDRLTFRCLLKSGKYDWISPDITGRRFRMERPPSEKLKFAPVELGRGGFVCNTVAKAHLKEQGLRPATIEELLLFGAQYPDEQRKYPISELGSVAYIHGLPCIAFLGANGSQRFVGVLAWDDEWSNAMRFLATECEMA